MKGMGGLRPPSYSDHPPFDVRGGYVATVVVCLCPVSPAVVFFRHLSESVSDTGGAVPVISG